MLGFQVLPMDNSLMVENAVTQISHFLPLAAEFVGIAQFFSRVWEGRFSQVVGDAGGLMRLGEKADPKTKSLPRDHASRRLRLAGLLELAFCLLHLIGLPLRKA